MPPCTDTCALRWRAPGAGTVCTGACTSFPYPGSRDHICSRSSPFDASCTRPCFAGFAAHGSPLMVPESRVASPEPTHASRSPLLELRIAFLVAAAIVVSPGTCPESDGAEDVPPNAVPSEVHQVLGDGVVGAAEEARPLTD